MAKLFRKGQVIKSIGDTLIIVAEGNCTDCMFGRSKERSRCDRNERNRYVSGIENMACAEVLPTCFVFQELKEGV
jgi:hypothetical protein